MFQSGFANLTILAVGIPLLVALTHRRLFREWFRSLLANRLVFFCIASIFLLLFWPVDPGETFKEGELLGWLRQIRVAVFILMAIVLMRYMASHAAFPRSSFLYIYAGYIMVCMISSYYAPGWQETLWKSFELFVLMLLALVVRNIMLRGLITPLQLIQGFSYLVFAAVFLSLIGGALFPEVAYSIQDEFVGTANKSMGGIVPRVNANTLGQFASMIAFVGFIIATIQRSIRVDAMFLILVGLFGMVFAHSRTSILAFVILISAFSLFTNGLRGLITIAFASIVGLLTLDHLAQFATRGQDADLFLSMSGRTYMWGIAWESILREPWLGLGFYSGHKTLDVVIEMEFSSLDSTYIETLVNVGIVGASFLFAFVLIMLVRMGALFVKLPRPKSPDFWWLSVTIGYVFIMFIRSLSGPSFQALHFNLLLILIIAAAWELHSKKKLPPIRD